MRKRIPGRLRLLLLLLLPLLATGAEEPAAVMGQFLNVPNSEFATTVSSTITGITNAISVVSQFGSLLGDFRLSNAINDCLDLLDLSSDLLSRTLDASQTGKTSGGTGRVSADLRTWLSAALISQDTCVDGLQGTDSFVKDLIIEGVNQVSSLVRQVLYMVQDDDDQPATGPQASSHGTGSFPHWVSSKNRKLLQAATTLLPRPDAVVAQDGSGNFTTITDAVETAPDHSTQRFVIYVKRGVYKEYVEIKRKKTNIMLYGDGIDATVITGDRSNAADWTTYRSATLAVTGAGFIMRDMTIQNTAGPQNHQAVAFRSDSDLSAVYRVAFRGYQDTLYTHANRQFYGECIITGTVDFIFGDAVAVFQNCLMYAKKGLPDQKNTVTAQGRKDPGEITGFSIQFCNITGHPDANATYLGRPWKGYSRTVIMETYIGNVVRPEGWLEWNGNMSLDTLFYAEYMNYGPGAALQSRVKWPGYRVFNDPAQAANFTVAQFIGGNLWLPETGVRYRAGLSTL